jgi:2-polyprenyl-3-methyl-5-hydroxy-6-metoxy-1,4-benzoquinol methylase
VGRPVELSPGKSPILEYYCTGRRVFDIGCVGDHTTIEELADSQFARLAAIGDATGVDINSAGVDYLCRLGLDCRVLNAMDIGTLDREPFDIVFVGDLLEHLPNPGDFLKTFRRLVNPGCRVLISTPNALHWLNPVGIMPPRTRE